MNEVLRNNLVNERPIVITRGGEPAGVLPGPRTYGRLTYQKRFVDSVNQGLSDISAGRVYSARAVRKRVSRLVESRKR